MNPDKHYKVPAATSIGHVHLKVSDIKRSLSFFCDLLGFELVTTYGPDAAFVSAGGYHHHIGLNTWHSKGGSPAPRNSTGLFHLAIRYPERKELAQILKRLIESRYPIGGASDHGVSEAIYLEDPDGNGIELYWDKPRKHWPLDEEGRIEMYTRSLDLEGLLVEAENEN